MSDDLTQHLLCRAATAAERRPIFLAEVFARYRAAEGLDNEALAERFGIAVDRLCALALCRRPRETAFRDDVTAISERFAVGAAALADVIRRVEALNALSESAGAQQGLLAAARDAEDTSTPESGDKTP